jgi:ribosomal protein S18 acetylase RimI-like enzyme
MKESLELLVNQYIDSFIHSFKAAYNSVFEEIDGVKIFHYGREFTSSPHEVVPFQSIVFAKEQPASSIDRIARNYSFQGDGSFAIQVFHEEMDPHECKHRYQPFSYEYFFPSILQMIDLENEEETHAGMSIKQARQTTDADRINSSFGSFKPFPERLLTDKQSTVFYSELYGQVICWGFLVHAFTDTSYAAGIFTLPEFRRQGAASAILNEMHRFARTLGAQRVLLVPSFMAWNFYTKRGYKTIAYFSTFLPADPSNGSKS